MRRSSFVAAALGMVAGIVCAARAGEIDIEAGSITGEIGSAVDASDAVVRMRGSTLRANEMNYDKRTGVIRAHGAVSVEDGAGTVLRAGTVDFDIGARTATAGQGASLRSADGILLEAEHVEYSFAHRAGSAAPARITGEGDPGKLRARRAAIGDYGYVLEEARYTTCKIDDPDWELRADRIELGRDRVMRATAASLVLGGVPVFYIPAMTFDLSRARRSGLLSPDFKYRDGGEYVLRLPYYLNLAPNVDAVVGAKLIGKRGALLFAQPRWLFPSQHGSASGGYISDSLAGSSRHYWKFRHTMERGAMRLDLAAMRISDELVATDFLGDEEAAVRHFPASARLGWDGGAWRAGLLVLHHQTVFAHDTAVVKPYDVQPELSYSWNGSPAERVQVAADAEWTRFTSAAGGPGMPGDRLWGRLTARRDFALAHGRAQLSGGLAGASYSRAGKGWQVPHVAFDYRYPVGLAGELFGRQVRQSFEPRLFAAFVRRASFAAIPVYDTARIPLSYEQMFAVNPFAGGDRFEDSSFISYGFDAVVRDVNERREFLSARIGQQLRFSSSAVRALDETVPAAGLSSALAEVRVRLTEALTSTGLVEWNPNGGWEQVQTEMRYVEDDSAYGIRYARSDFSDTQNDRGSAGASLWRPLGERMQVAVDVSFNLNDARLDTVSSGLRRVAECGCWQVDVLLKHQKIAQQRDSTSISLQLVLNGLGGAGNDRFDRLIRSLSERL